MTPGHIQGGSRCRGRGWRRVWDKMIKDARHEPPCSMPKICDMEVLRRMSWWMAERRGQV
jgi:hypothetical protein